jgi:hypothetical protein
MPPFNNRSQYVEINSALLYLEEDSLLMNTSNASFKAFWNNVLPQNSTSTICIAGTTEAT